MSILFESHIGLRFYSITSTFDDTQTDIPALKVKVILPLHAHEQNRPDGRAGLSVCHRMSILSPKCAILIWIFILSLFNK